MENDLELQREKEKAMNIAFAQKILGQLHGSSNYKSRLFYTDCKLVIKYSGKFVRKENICYEITEAYAKQVINRYTLFYLNDLTKKLKFDVCLTSQGDAEIYAKKFSTAKIIHNAFMQSQKIYTNNLDTRLFDDDVDKLIKIAKKSLITSEDNTKITNINCLTNDDMDFIEEFNKSISSYKNNIEK